MSKEGNGEHHDNLEAKLLAIRQDVTQSRTYPVQSTDDDYTSSSGTSSDDDDDDDDDDEVDETYNEEPDFNEQNVENLARSAINRPTVNGDLKSRLAEFLPQLQKANQDLENTDDAHARQIDAVDDEEQHYVEMDLSLGVLTEKQSEDEVHTRDSSEDDENLTTNDQSQVQKVSSPDNVVRSRKTKIEEL